MNNNKTNLRHIAISFNIGIILLLTACQTLPSLANRSIETHITANNPSTLSYVNAPLIAQHPNLSGIYPLDDGSEALVARRALIHAAEHSLDVQYYIWHNDTSGQLLFHELVKAAHRGVHVRLLLDDNNTKGMDPILHALNKEPNIEIRLFNPFADRYLRFLGYLTDFSRLNRRMHNKSITADNQVTILGGRNIGDEYFDIGKKMLFVDLDVMAIGPIVNQVSNNFDLYWNSASSYSLSSIIHRRRNKLHADMPIFKRKTYNFLRASHYDQAYLKDNFERRLTSGTLDYQWVHLTLVSDDPAKALPNNTTIKHKKQENSVLLAPDALPKTTIKFENASMTLNQLAAAVVEPQKKLMIITPYFVPTKTGLDYLLKLRREGVHIIILTNSLSATDVPIVHSGYINYRIPLLQNGIEIYELKKQGVLKSKKEHSFSGGSQSSLHAKTFTIDGNQLYIGSLNFDPRSSRLNTEMGVVIKSPEMAQYMDKAIKDALPFVSYQVKLTKDGKLEWVKSDEHNQIKIYHQEPDTSKWQRIWVKILSILPIEGLL
ncbi:MAG: phospholipase D family protein [Snodgrassella sp.]|nr:phospholipase D family protein [Snodgrassella sp.]